MLLTKFHARSNEESRAVKILNCLRKNSKALFEEFCILWLCIGNIANVMALKTRRQSRLEEEEHAAAAVEGSGHSAPEEIKDDLVTKQTAANLEKSNGASSSASSSSSSSSDDESSSGEDSDSEYSSAEEQDLEKLFQASLLACKEKDEATCSGTISSAFEANVNQISFSELERTVENHPPKSLIGSKGKG